MDRLEKLTLLLKSSPQDSFLHHALALELLKIGEVLKARTILEQVLERDPSYIGSYYQLGKLIEQLGDTKSAMDWFAKGMVAAKAAGEKKAYNELYAAFEELSD